MIQEELLQLTSDIVSAHAGNNPVSVDALPQLIEAVYGSLSSLGKEPEPSEAQQKRNPAVSIRASVKADAIACLECGAKQKTLKRHLTAQHNLTPEEYRARWKLPADYPMISADYAAKRAALAIEIGLGSKGGRKKKAPVPAQAKPAAGKPASAKASDPIGAQGDEVPAAPKAKRAAGTKSTGKSTGKTPSKRKTKAG
ncbi:MucR family transcriptional regulator [Novosphingobium sp. RL4]|uniref:MucR family transcriptional regulator n=1 Tax=Novosphingobium sp. RL4 TaxID=3109595 RepID=UPI002D77A57C|nr:MucR family transcriptional regulator [Novosphingobium sp. RL4]WRT94471.1 MucR family transcriptional regulator [Novosphingobium sp. RL4]